MKKQIFFGVFVFWVQFIYVQEIPVSWGGLERQSGSLLEILPRTNSDFYALRWTGGRTFGSYQITNHENLTFIQKKRIKQVAEHGIANFERALNFGDKLHIFLSDRNNGQMSLYDQVCDSEMELSGSTELIASYSNNKLNAKPNFKILQSLNRQYIGVVWEIPGKRSTSDLYGYKVFDIAMNVVQSGEYVIPLDGNLTTINEHYL
jgi:hypothetical protein